MFIDFEAQYTEKIYPEIALPIPLIVKTYM